MNEADANSGVDGQRLLFAPLTITRLDAACQTILPDLYDRKSHWVTTLDDRTPSTPSVLDCSIRQANNHAVAYLRSPHRLTVAI